MIEAIGPTECSRANGRRPQDGTRYVRSLLARVEEIENIANHAGYEIIIRRKS